MEKQPFQNKLLGFVKDLQNYKSEQEAAHSKAMAAIDDPKTKAILAEAMEYAQKGKIQEATALIKKLHAS